MATANKHDYHIVNPSIWPFAGAVAAFFMLIGAVMWMKDMTAILFFVGLAGVLAVMALWWTDVIRESREGDHTPVVRIGLRYGFILFIISEVMFFVAWFWSYFHYALFPPEESATFENGGQFPPQGVEAFDPWGLPLVNTLILLLSGATLTAAHHYLVEMREESAPPSEVRKWIFWLLAGTCILGAIFLVCQAIEYYEAYHHDLTLQSDYYGAAFFMATGFHGMHVLVGTIFLTVCLWRVSKGHFTPEKHIGFEAAAWYWHFVDVVWLFLFAVIYIGSVSFFATGT